METQVAKRLYQVWKGSNRFFCGGRLIFGPDVISLLMTITLIAGPSIAFACQIIVKIHNREKLAYHHHTYEHSQILGYPVLIVTLIVTLADLIFLFLTSSRDPGIVPRSVRPPESEETFDGATPSMEWVSGRTPHLRLPRTKDVSVNGFVVKVKYCETCFLYRPPRASHCSICNNCVQKFDHHCPWVGQCIGLRNYRFFFLFISSSTFLCIYVFTISWLNIIGERKHYTSLWKSMTSEVLSLVLIIYTFVAVWFVGGLTVFHAYLISTNQTTYENFRYRYDKKENPYNKGLFGNFKDVFFSKIPSSMNDFRSWVFEDSKETGTHISTNGISIISSKEKIDIEMGMKCSPGSSTPIPSILQNLDYSIIDDNLKMNNRQEADVNPDPFDFPTAQEPLVEGSRDSDACCNETHGQTVTDTPNVTISTNEISNPNIRDGELPQT
ncbi:palmitoyltransferase ZDHHC9/14/18 protein [Dioscorea alata]|uniref:Palmitoyltransferase ZDHHC9/14/18 protein n=1 Tax=Dioscorea alata TaxID=55571 RepID=A0ACB7V231_DIOAL|nr:palmitoyltransferase ZDHHC9/14/18 protein [Dioscorea alata]